jgi:hypothetical protein
MDLYKEKLFSESLKEILLEDIYGAKATVYHRTKEKDLINLIFKDGYKPKDTSNYGIGMYATYDLKHQIGRNKDYMEHKYGSIIVKMMIKSINNFLVLDYKEFKKTNLFKKLKSKKKNFIIDQLKHFNFQFLEPEQSLEDFEFRESKYSSDIFNQILSYFGGHFKIKRYIDGVFFTSDDEGKNIVCYNTDLIIPLSFSLNDGKDWIKPNKDINYLKKVFSQYTDDVKVKYKKDTKIKHWIEDAKISSDADYEIDDIENYDIKYRNYFTWENGIWYSGVWYNGTWENGTWKKGTWLKGYFEGGTWEDGTWKDGTFGSIFWNDDDNPIWEKGIWEKGTWNNAIWKNGDWLDGTWKGGTWLGGTWHGGKDKFGRFHPQGDSPDKWNI